MQQKRGLGGAAQSVRAKFRGRCPASVLRQLLLDTLPASRSATP